MEQHHQKYLSDYRPPPFHVDHLDMTLELEDLDTRVTSFLNLRRHSETAQPETALVLDGRNMDLIAVELDGRPLTADEFRVAEETLTIPDVPDAFTLKTVAVIRPAANTSLEGLYKSGDMFCTQCEAEGFRKITYFIDRPDVMATYTCTLIADRSRYPILLCNGNPVDSGDMEDGRHWVKWDDPFKKPSYLFALVAGDLALVEDTYRTRSGREVSLRIYVEHMNADKCDYALSSLKKAMRWDEEVFGLEYDLDVYMIVAATDFNMGAMENKGLNVFNAKYVLARPETATDIDFWNIDRVVSHEYFHNWTGNRVTLRDWFQLSLKEGLTVFRDQEFTADITSRPVKRISDVKALRTFQFPEDAGPMAHPVRPDSYIEMDNFYTVTIYEKGAEVIRMIHTIIGHENFLKGLALYIQRHDGTGVTIEEFVKAMADAGGTDLEQFMRWYSQAGTPEIRADRTYDPDNQVYTLTLTQHIPATPDQPDKEPMHIPIAAGLLDSKGKELPLQLKGEPEPVGTTRVLNLREWKQGFEFIHVPEEPIPSLPRGFSAPVRLKAGYTDEEQGFLFAHDSDEFIRWDAGQNLFAKVLLQLISGFQQDKEPSLDRSLLDPLKKTLLNPDLDKSFIAHALSLPSESEMAIVMSETGPIDPDAIHQARNFLTRTIAETLQAEFEQVFDENQTPEPYTVDPPTVGRRSLKNLALAYLGKIESPDRIDFLFRQFKEAENMTDTLAALSILSHIDCDQRTRAIEEFHDKWQSDVVVLDKWFSIQAGSQLSGILDRVKALLDHPAFSIKNPNKVRALIGAFCSLNPWRFHQPSGDGYAFLADRVLELNTLNPQIASRLVSAFNHWRKYEPGRKALMKAQLERISQNPDLSKHVYEIVSKALA